MSKLDFLTDLNLDIFNVTVKKSTEDLNTKTKEASKILILT